jgi:hypothetical protein
MLAKFEALYALEQPREAWFSGVLRAAAAVLGRGAGSDGVLYDAARQGDLRTCDLSQVQRAYG